MSTLSPPPDMRFYPSQTGHAELNCLTSDRKPVSVELEIDCGQTFSPTDKKLDTSALISTCSIVSKTLQVRDAVAEEEGAVDHDEEGDVDQVVNKDSDVGVDKGKGKSGTLNLVDVGGVPDAARFLVRKFQGDEELNKAIPALALHLKCGGWVQQLPASTGGNVLRGQFQCSTKAGKTQLETYLRNHPRPESKGDFVTSQFDVSWASCT